MAELPKFVDAGVMAETLGVTYRTVLTLVKTGKIPAIRVGRGYRFDPQKVIEHLNLAADEIRPTVKPGSLKIDLREARKQALLRLTRTLEHRKSNEKGGA